MSGTVPNQPPSSSPRRFPRYPLDVHLSVHVFRSGGRVSLWGRSNELGEDGIGATLTGELEAGEVVLWSCRFPWQHFPSRFAPPCDTVTACATALSFSP